MSPAAQAAKRDQALREAVNDVAHTIGIPDVQVGHHAVTIVPAQIEGWDRSHDKTLRKLTRVERLFRSGAIEQHQVDAINLYVASAEIAYATCVRVASYGEGGGGSSPTGAASAAHDRQLDRTGEADRYRRAKGALPVPYVTAFERIVLDNHPIGLVGADMWPGSSAGTVSGAVRELVRTCADSLCLEFKDELATTSQRISLLKTMGRMDQTVCASRGAAAAQPVTDAIAAKAASLTAEDHALFVSPSVLADLMRENAIADQPASWAGRALVKVEHWQFGWLLQPLAIS